jgi:hypothetical protein
LGLDGIGDLGDRPSEGQLLLRCMGQVCSSSLAGIRARKRPKGLKIKVDSDKE